MASNQPRRPEPGFHHPPHLQQHHSQLIDSAAPWPSRQPRPYFASSRDPRHYCRGHSEPPSSALWKDLPALPTNYRLGEGLPWDMGAEPGADPDDLVVLPYTRRPTVLPIEAEARAEAECRRREDPLRKRNLENLSAAMMTVDNGFESQWWYRGDRVAVAVPAQSAEPAEPVESVEQRQREPDRLLQTPSIFTAPAPPPTQPSLGWAIAEPQRPSSSFSPPMPVSPFSPYSPDMHSPSSALPVSVAEMSTSLRGHTFPPVPQHDVLARGARPEREPAREPARDFVSPVSETASVAPWSDSSRTFVGGSRPHPHRRRSTQSEELFLTGYYG